MSEFTFDHPRPRKIAPLIQLSRVVTAVALAFGLTGDKGSSDQGSTSIGENTLTARGITPEEKAALDRRYGPKRSYDFLKKEPLKDSLSDMMGLFKNLMGTSESPGTYITVFEWPDDTGIGSTASYGYMHYPAGISAKPGGGQSGFQVFYHVGSTLDTTSFSKELKEQLALYEFPLKVAVLDEPHKGLQHALVGPGKLNKLDICTYRTPCSVGDISGEFRREIEGLEHHILFKKDVPDR
ncbi:MAG: hypothetical protein Q8L37_00210 [Candidatus Gottesmanbacteria bacterium]|nr:hypothetical protein [Candidatus Gottesmanbacteria bacterium]